MPQRVLGRSDEKISVIGFGGIMLNNEDRKTCNDIVAKACETGINYFDVAPTYGNAEEMLGPALEPYRRQSFLSCKSTQRERAGVEKEMQESFTRLRTDYFDLYQLHALTTIEDVERSFASNGAMEAILRARDQGRVRLIGFSAHSEEAALLALEYFDFDTVMFPINFACWHNGNFGPRVYEKAVERNLGILVLKSLAERGLRPGEERFFTNVWYKPVLDNELFDQALAFSLSRKITSVIPPGNMSLFLKAIDRVHHFEPLTAEEEEALRKRSLEIPPLFSA
ncbi:MAG: aldo/keto reductase [Marinilabiliales bacterium]|nr:MAG: aldo/keto reductase [Marinilabiliales bacterium]